MKKNPQKTSLTTYRISIDGREIDAAYHVESIRIVKEANKIPFAQISFLERETSGRNFETSNSRQFEPGKEIEIKAGDMRTNTIYKGIIIGQKLMVRNGRPSTLVVEAKDKVIRTTIGRKNRYFLNTKDSDIINTILGEYSLGADIDATEVAHEEMIQYYSSDWDFLSMRAEKNGLIVFVEDGKVKVKRPGLSKAPKLKLSYGDDIFEMEVEMDATTQLQSVSSSSWDYSTQSVMSANSMEPSVNEQGNLTGKKLSDVAAPSQYDIFHTGDIDTEELKVWSNAKLLKSRLTKIRGWVIIEGNNDVSLGDIIELRGVGERFKGNAFVSGIRHDISGGIWRTHYHLGLSDEWPSPNRTATEIPASGLLSGVTGLQIGKVQNIATDPEGEFRIQVKLPLIDSDGVGIWARMARFYASKGVGAFFMPEIDDEVIVGFMNDDPRFPIVLGCMHSSKLPAPLTADDQNSQKAIITKSKLTLLFDDKHKVVEIQTPGKNVITISDKDKGISIQDQNKNKVVLGTSGILLDSPKDISIKAKGNINIQANANITTKANGNVSIEGLNVSNKAKAKFEASGSAGADLKTPAIATIQGSLVKIN